MKQCTQSPATTGLVVTYSKSSPNTLSFVFRNSILCRLFLQPLYMHYTLSLSQTLRFCIYTHDTYIHTTHIRTCTNKHTYARPRNNFARHLIIFVRLHIMRARVYIYMRIVLACVCCVALSHFNCMHIFQCVDVNTVCAFYISISFAKHIRGREHKR